MNLVYKNEERLFVIAAIISTLFWIALLGATYGLALVYVLLGALMYLFVQSGFISHIKGNGVKVTAEQFPDLLNSLNKCCDKIGMDAAPEMYLLRADFFNAFATKFLGRNFVVLFTDVIDALADEPTAIDFYVGHELGHIHRNHLKWKSFLFPALLLPVLGTGYRRAQEYTCDRYGAYCCDSDDDVRSAMAAMSAGNTRWKDMSSAAYSAQSDSTSEFWMSFHEFTNDYPWQTKRMGSALAFRKNEEIKHPRRNFLAGLLSIFVPRVGGVGGGASTLLVVAMIGILAAIAIPAYQDYSIRAQVSEGLNLSGDAKAAVTGFVRDYSEWPTDNSAVGLTPANEIAGLYVSGISVQEGEVIVTYGNGAHASIQGKTLVLSPDASNLPTVSWSCYSLEIANKWLPAACRSN